MAEVKEPPDTIDGTRVFYWAWSGDEPYYGMPVEGGEDIPIHRLAVCVYEDSGTVYRLACNARWESENDAPYGSLEAAMSGPSGQFDIGRVAWREKPKGS